MTNGGRFRDAENLLAKSALRYPQRMPLLSPTPPEHLVDCQGRPYFLWDQDMTLDQFKAAIRAGDRVIRAWLVGKMMREAKPDDVYTFVTLREIADLWPDLQPHLGRSKPFWTWILGEWGVIPRG